MDDPSFFFFFLMSVHRLGKRHEEFRRFEPATNWLYTHQTLYENHYKNGIIQADKICHWPFRIPQFLANNIPHPGLADTFLLGNGLEKPWVGG